MARFIAVVLVGLGVYFLSQRSVDAFIGCLVLAAMAMGFEKVRPSGTKVEQEVEGIRKAAEENKRRW